MRSTTQILFALLCISAGCMRLASKLLIPELHSGPVSTLSSNVENDPRSTIPDQQVNDQEALFALGEKICLGAADWAALELIPGVGHATARSLHSQRATLLKIARASSDEREVHAFTHLHGIGEKRSALLHQYITFCNQDGTSGGQMNNLRAAEQFTIFQPLSSD